MKTKQNKIIMQIDEFIRNNHQNSNLNHLLICKELGLSRTQLHRIVKKNTHYSIRHFRLEKAKVLLNSTQLRISEIAYEVGFNLPQNFSKYFTEEFEFCPIDFRKQIDFCLY